VRKEQKNKRSCLYVGGKGRRKNNVGISSRRRTRKTGQEQRTCTRPQAEKGRHRTILSATQQNASNCTEQDSLFFSSLSYHFHLTI